MLSNLKEVLHPNWPFGVANTVQPFMCPFFSFRFMFSKYDYHMVQEEKWNIYDLKNIDYTKVEDLFFLSVSKVCASLICSGDICPGVYVWGVCVLGNICPGGKCPGGYMFGGKCPGGKCLWGGGGVMS